MSISACAAHGLALGLDSSQVTGLAKKLSWVEMEERRQVWWAIVIVERFDVRLRKSFIFIDTRFSVVHPGSSTRALDRRLQCLRSVACR
jgi:hypothetical protein